MVLRCHRTLRSLCKAHLCDRRWSDDELCEPAEVLRDCRQCELELSTTWSTQAQTTEPKDTLEMCKQHLNTFAIATRSLECFGFGPPPVPRHGPPRRGFAGFCGKESLGSTVP